VLPADSHVHTQWSWDAAGGSMEDSCARAVELGLASIAFTEHADFTRWAIEHPGELDAADAGLVGSDGLLVPPALDVNGYLECVRRCRGKFADLRILSGLELGEPHWHPGQVTALLRDAQPDRVLGSVHTLALHGPRMVDHLFGRLDPGEIVRRYLDEVLRLAQSAAPFAVLAHIDYPVRYWPAEAGCFAPAVFEEEYRGVLTALARSGRALEVNTSVPLPAMIVRWWREAGGQTLTFGSDAHEPSGVAGRFAEAAAMAEAAGFSPGRYPHDFWRRRGPLTS
jgi:histidinol-phosphatase (PHP family)